MLFSCIVSVFFPKRSALSKRTRIALTVQWPRAPRLRAWCRESAPPRSSDSACEAAAGWSKKYAYGEFGRGVNGSMRRPCAGRPEAWTNFMSTSRCSRRATTATRKVGWSSVTSIKTVCLSATCSVEHLQLFWRKGQLLIRTRTPGHHQQQSCTKQKRRRGSVPRGRRFIASLCRSFCGDSGCRPAGSSRAPSTDWCAHATRGSASEGAARCRLTREDKLARKASQ